MSEYVKPTMPTWREKPLAHLVSRLFTARFLDKAPGRIRGAHWFRIMAKNGLRYSFSEWIINVVYDAEQIEALRLGVQIEHRRERRRALERSGLHQHLAKGTVCPGCGRASLHGGHCSGSLLRRHSPMRRRSGLVSYWS